MVQRIALGERRLALERRLDRPNLDLHHAAVDVAFDLVQLGTRHARRDPFEIGQRVYVLEDGRIRAREVTTGIGNWEHTEITGGIEAGANVVVSVDREGLADGVAAVAR